MATLEYSGEAVSNDRLSFTLFLALAVHALLIFGVTFTLEKGSQVAPTLNITIATHQAKKAPEKADFLAQYDQEASGTAEEVKELTATRQAEIDDKVVRQVNPEVQQKATQVQVSEKQLVTTQSQSDRAQQQRKDAENQEEQQERAGKEVETPLLSQEYASLKAKLDQEKQELASKPRIRRLTSVSTKASHDAAYLNDWAQQVEQVGNKNFPQAAIDQKLFGSLRMAVLLKPNGVVDNIEIIKSSGHSILDQAALQIVRKASPFKPIPPEVRRDNDKLEIIRTWRFEITGLSTTH